MRREGRRYAVSLAPQIRDDNLEEQIAAYLKSTEEWEPADGVPAARAPFLAQEAPRRSLRIQASLSKRYAIVSIGTNSTRLLLADVAPDDPHVELARSTGTRIGEGLGERGHLGDEPMQRTLDAIDAIPAVGPRTLRPPLRRRDERAAARRQRRRVRAARRGAVGRSAARALGRRRGGGLVSRRA